MLSAFSFCLLCCACAIAIGLQGAGQVALDCCKIGVDTFTDPDGSSIPGWTKLSGTAGIASGKISMTASNTVIFMDAPDPHAGLDVNASVDVVAGNNGDVVRLIIKEKNETYSDCIVGELVVGPSGTMKIFQRIAGVETQLGTTTNVPTAAGTTYSLTLCFNNIYIVFVETVTTASVSRLSSLYITGQPYAGLACGSIGSQVTFDNFVFNAGYANPNACCVYCNCSFAEDSFNRFNSSDINLNSPCGWQIDNGSFAIVSAGSTHTAATSSTMAAAKCGKTALGQRMELRVSVSGWATGDTIRLMLNYVDKDNYYAGEFTSSLTSPYPGRTRIIKRVSGSETIMVDMPTVGGILNAPIEIGYDPDNNRMWAGGQYVYYNAAAVLPPPTSPSIAFGTGGTVSGSVKFQALYFQRGAPECGPLTKCNGCIDQYAVGNSLQIVLSGIAANVPPVCSTCPSLNGTYVTTFIGTTNNGLPTWMYKFPSPICGFNYLYATPLSYISSSPIWNVLLSPSELYDLTNNSGIPRLWQSSGYHTNQNCKTLSGLLCSYQWYFGGDWSTSCDPTNAQAALTFI